VSDLHPVEHVVEYQDSGHPDGFVAVLEPHRGGLLDWTDDGLTCAPGQPCTAIAEVSNARCAKREAVVFLIARTKYSKVGTGFHDIFVCGGHFISHRAGKPIRVIVTPARAR
jgi:hypothetical protein